MTAMVRAQSLRGYRNLVRTLGGDPARLLRRSGIRPALLNNLTAFITFDAFVDLLERSAAELECPDFGLSLSERQDIGVLGTLAVAMRYSATVGAALRCASKYMYVYNAAVAFTVAPREHGPQSLLAFDLIGGPPSRRTQTSDHGIGLAWRIITMLSEGRSTLRHVWLPHRSPGAETLYRSRFDAPLSFNAKNAAVAIDTDDLDLPISESNAGLHDLAVSHLVSQVPTRADLRTRVRRAVEAHLGTGTCSYRDIASTLHMHPRSLQRQLREESTNFESIKDQARQDLAQRYLAQPDVPLSQVAALLDYSEQSTLGRSCQRWFDTSPQAMRKRLNRGPELQVSGA